MVHFCFLYLCEGVNDILIYCRAANTQLLHTTMGRTKAGDVHLINASVKKKVPGGR